MTTLWDRRPEGEALDPLLTAIRVGSSQVLVAGGEAGIGKTALRDYPAGRALGCRVARDEGDWSEMELALAGPHQLCAPKLNGDKALPAPQREALRTALMLRTDATGAHLPPYAALVPAAWRGRDIELAMLIESAARAAMLGSTSSGLIMVGWAQAVLRNSLGRYKEALIVAERADDEDPEALGAPIWVLVELIEAAARCGQAGRAADALARLTDTTRSAGTDWALGIEARSRALLSDGPAAEDLYCEAIERLGRTRLGGELARAHLLYGEWLRRERRRFDAREQLRVAYEMFSQMGMEGFAQRAGRELRATGETARKRTAETGTDLTAQEVHIARLVLEGVSSSEIAAQMFLSRRTVERHLSKIFSKLGITSRRELHRHPRLR